METLQGVAFFGIITSLIQVVFYVLGIVYFIKHLNK